MEAASNSKVKNIIGSEAIAYTNLLAVRAFFKDVFRLIISEVYRIV